MNIFQSRDNMATAFFRLSSLSAVQRLVSGYDRLIELDHKRCAFVPVGSDLRREATVCEDGLHDSCRESCAVQTAVLLGHRNVRVDKWLLFYDVIGLIIIIGLFQFVRLLSKQRLPDVDLQQRELLVTKLAKVKKKKNIKSNTNHTDLNKKKHIE